VKHRPVLYKYIHKCIPNEESHQRKPKTHKNNSTIHNSTNALCAGKEVLSIDSAGKISLKPGASLDQLPPTGAQQFLFQVAVDLNI
jgi:hypothetical protein